MWDVMLEPQLMVSFIFCLVVCCTQNCIFCVCTSLFPLPTRRGLPGLHVHVRVADIFWSLAFLLVAIDYVPASGGKQQLIHCIVQHVICPPPSTACISIPSSSDSSIIQYLIVSIGPLYPHILPSYILTHCCPRTVPSILSPPH